MSAAGSSGMKRPFGNEKELTISKKKRAADTEFETTLPLWSEEPESDSSNDEEVPANFVPEKIDYGSDSEMNISDNSFFHEDQPEAEECTSDYYYGKNGYRWAKDPSKEVLRTLQLDVTIMRLPSSRLVKSKDAYCVWNNLIDNKMLNEIVKCTNARLNRYKHKFLRDKRTELKDLDVIELKAFLAILFYLAALRSNHESVDNVFATDGSGREIFRCIMSKLRFLVLLRSLRFDSSDLSKRKADKLAPISFLLNSFVKNSQKLYNLGECVTVDETLIPFRGRSTMIVYMPRKPVKYGLKFMTMCDSKSNYFYNGYIYSGKGSDGEGLSSEEKNFLIPTQSILRLTKPIYGTNRTVTAGSCYSSVQLVNILKNKGLRYVGTVNKNIREIPKEFLPNKNRTVGSSLFGFTDHATLCSYVPKQNKAMILISSTNHIGEVDHFSGEPEILAHYNSLKCGANETDKKCSGFTTGRKTRRWSMAVFYHILDLSATNACILYNTHLENSIEVGSFLKILARTLAVPHMQRRVLNTSLPRELRLTLERILGPDVPNEPPPATDKITTELKASNRKTCYLCPPKLRRKSSYSCVSCKKTICLQCAKQICKHCV